MCGIAGIIRFDNSAVAPRLLQAMTQQLEHRGPDGEGLWHRGPVGLAHRRLAIIDVAGSPQPMSSPDGRQHVCFNGEIFNYRQLRTALPYPYRTGGDTEVLLAGFSSGGPDAVRQLRGQFAYALYDEPARAMWLFRDRLGVLPLYYHVDDRRLIFASEVKAIAIAMEEDLEVDRASLDDYLARRSVAAPFTLFEGIRKLPPGHHLCVELTGRVTIQRYWTLPDPDEVLSVTDAEARRLVGHALDGAVQDALVADVPVGAYLSGGVDSSLIVATATRLRGSPVETFSAGFGVEGVDETHHARRVASLLGSRHHEVIIGADAFSDAWTKLTWHRDAPISEPADVAVWHLARTAREHVKVVLSGEGSDELFAGYPKHRIAAWSERLDALPVRPRSAAFRMLERALPPGQRRLRTAIRAMTGETAAQRTEGWFAPFTTYERADLLRRPPARAPERTSGGRDPLDRMLRHDCSGGWLADNLLERGDRMSMAASLELRPPFLDHRLVELAFRLPASVKLRGACGKWVVKELARMVLPADIVDRQKSGFVVPLNTWFRGALRSEANDRLLSADSFVGQVMDPAVIRRLLRDHDRGRRDEAARIWTLLCLEVWHETFFGRQTRRDSMATR